MKKPILFGSAEACQSSNFQKLNGYGKVSNSPSMPQSNTQKLRFLAAGWNYGDLKFLTMIPATKLDKFQNSFK